MLAVGVSVFAQVTDVASAHFAGPVHERESRSRPQCTHRCIRQDHGRSSSGDSLLNGPSFPGGRVYGLSHSVSGLAISRALLYAMSSVRTVDAR